MATEQPLLFDCNGDRLLGILHHPETPVGQTGMLLVVGGPQYRVGSHRQFVLLARALAGAGVPVLRFDYRGMGDSSGQPRDFEAVASDIRAAIDTFTTEAATVRHVVLWGLCDAATANAFYANSDDRVIGQIGANPWVRTPEGEAQVYIRHYYLERIASRAFWSKVMRLEFDVLSAGRDFLHKFRRSHANASSGGADTRALPERLREAQLTFAGPMLLLISGRDLTAQEYMDKVAESQDWQAWMVSPSVSVRRLETADHTFSSAAWRDQVAGWTRDWILALG